MKPNRNEDGEVVVLIPRSRGGSDRPKRFHPATCASIERDTTKAFEKTLDMAVRWIGAKQCKRPICQSVDLSDEIAAIKETPIP